MTRVSLLPALPVVVAAILLGGCTLVSIEGDGNSVSDTGGHGGGLTIPATAQGEPSLVERLRQHQQ